MNDCVETSTTMTGAQRLWTVGDLRQRRPELLVGSLSPGRVEIADLYNHIHNLFDKILKDLSPPHPWTFALGVPERRNGELIVNFPVFAAHWAKWNKTGADAKIREYIESASNNSLCLPINRCAVGKSLLFFTGRHMQGRIFVNLEQDIASCEDEKWLRLKEPERRYQGVFTRSWTAPEEPTSWHIVRPIVLSGGYVCGAFAIDTADKSADVDNPSGAGLLCDTIARLLHGYCEAFYSHLDPPTKEIVEVLGGSQWGSSLPGLPWSSAGRVFGPSYLDRFSELLDDGRSSTVTDGMFVMYCDGDGIKALNDAYGHYAGNEVIRMYGRALSEASERLWGDDQLGITDSTVVRWGGDEFVVCLRVNGDVDQRADRLANAYRAALDDALDSLTTKMERRLCGRPSLLPRNPKETGIRGIDKMVGISIGWATWKPGTSFRETWQRRAEQAMYLAKAIRRMLQHKPGEKDEHRIFMISADRAKEVSGHLTAALTSHAGRIRRGQKGGRASTGARPPNMPLG